MIIVQEIVECKLIINSCINGKDEENVIRGRGYYKNDNGILTVYFTSDNVKYKYVYEKDILKVYCNDSLYNFVLNKISN